MSDGKKFQRMDAATGNDYTDGMAERDALNPDFRFPDFAGGRA